MAARCWRTRGAKALWSGLPGWRTHPPISDGFQRAVHAHLRVLPTLGTEHPVAQCTMAMMLHHAPGWVRDELDLAARDVGLIPGWPGTWRMARP